MCVRLRCCLPLWSFLLALPLSAGVLYDNGPIKGTSGVGIASWIEGTHNEWYMAADSFTLSANSSITGVTFGAEFYTGDSGLTVDWAITTTPFGPALAQGTANLSGTFLLAIPAYDMVAWSESFSISPVRLGAGTYWLQLSNCMTVNYNWAYWDMNRGTSVAYQKYQYQDPSGLYPGQGQLPYSESFQILGSVPEPGSLVLLSSGALLLAIRRFRSRAGRVSCG